MKLHDGLTPRQVYAAQLLAKGLQRQQVAERLGVSQVTVWSWTKRDAFQRRYESFVNAELRLHAAVAVE